MKLSIITIVKNPSLEFLKTAIASVICQKGLFFEYIIVDASDVPISNYIKELCFNNDIKYVRQQSVGLWAAFEEGFEIARGDIIGIINSDDFFSSSVFKTVMMEFDDKSVDFVFGNSRRVNVDSKPLYTHRPPILLLPTFAKLLTFTVSHHTVFFKRSILDEISFIDNRFSNHFDLVFIVKLFKNYKYKYIDSVFANFRITGENASMNSYKTTSITFHNLNGISPRFYILSKIISCYRMPKYFYYLMAKRWLS